MTTHKHLVEKLQDAILAMAFDRAGTGIAAAWTQNLAAHVSILPAASMPGGCTTACVTLDHVYFAEEFLTGLDVAEALYLCAHETLHVALGHLDQAVMLGVAQLAPPREDGSPGGYLTVPGKEHEDRLLGIAQDIFINENQNRAKLGRMPKGGCTLATLATMVPGVPYPGALVSTEIWAWLKANLPAPPPPPRPQPQQGQSQGQQQSGSTGVAGAPALQGCRPQGIPGKMTSAKAEQMAASIREAAGIGSGSVLAQMLKPEPKRMDWYSILRDCFETASADAEDRSERSYARPSRRDGDDPDIIEPGLVGTRARVCGILDASGSVGREWCQVAVEKIIALGDEFPAVEFWLGVHTDRTVWSGWLNPATDIDLLTEATKFTGGTNATATYREAREVAAATEGFDVTIHFTDSELPSWPTPPAGRYLVGLLPSPGTSNTVPAGIRTILCTP